MSAPRRQTPMPPQLWAVTRPLTVRFLTAMLAGLGVAQVTFWAFGLNEIAAMLALDTQAVRSGEFWRIFTSQGVHAGFFPFAATILVLLGAGREVEPIIGPRALIGICISASLLGAIANLATAGTVPVYGCSAAVSAIAAAYCTIMPEAEIVGRLRARHFTVALVALPVIALATNSGLSNGPAGMLVGAGIGWMGARQLGFGRPFWLERRRIARDFEIARRECLTAEEFMAEHMDPILEKISREGIGSLSRTERRLLEEGRCKLLQGRHD